MVGASEGWLVTQPCTHAPRVPPHRVSQAPAAKLKVGDSIWLRGPAKGTEPFVPASVTNLQQNG